MLDIGKTFVCNILRAFYGIVVWSLFGCCHHTFWALNPPVSTFVLCWAVLSRKKRQVWVCRVLILKGFLCLAAQYGELKRASLSQGCPSGTIARCSAISRSNKCPCVQSGQKDFRRCHQPLRRRVACNGRRHRNCLGQGFNPAHLRILRSCVVRFTLADATAMVKS